MPGRSALPADNTSRLELGHEFDVARALPEQTTSGVSADHPGVNELFALLAYGEVAAFYRLTDEARMAPNLRGRINMASMAAAEMSHYEVLRDALERRGVDVVPAMTKYASALENYHRLTTPSTWLEALGEDLHRRRAGRRLLPGDRRRDARRGGRRGARGAVGDRRTRSSSSPRCRPR